MDKIIESFIDDFKNEFNFGSIEKAKLFEHFINYIIVSKIYPDRSSVDKINVGGTRNPGIDGLAIMVNGHLVTSEEEVDYFIEDTDELNVEFVFIQSKTSDKFEMGSINTFLLSVKEFFRDGALTFEDDLLNLRDLKNYIYQKSIKMQRSPDVKLYYATTGKWFNDQNLNVIITSFIQDMKETGLFSVIVFSPLDADKIKSLYREIKNKITREIIFEKHTILPNITNITESYLGILPAIELTKLISDEEGEIIKTIFYANVRDFQGFNKVNSGIRKSIETMESKDKFVLLNNGITIVAKSLNKVGSAFKLNDFQIVNGCQTSHVLHSLRNEITEKIFIPLKLIVTDNDDVTNDIIKATNSQTEVKNEAFEILRPFHKKLEEFYLSFEKNDNQRVYYERRSRQFFGIKPKSEKIIGLPTQIAAFVAMFLNEPQSTHRYFGELLKAYSNRMFQDEHSFYPYYVSGLALCVIDDLFKINQLNNSIRRYKYHLLLMFRVHIAGEKIPKNNFSNKDMEKYCIKIAENLWDRKKAKEIFQRLETKLITALTHTSVLKRQAHSIRAFTEELIPNVKNMQFTGQLTYYNSLHGYGFIHIDNSEEDVFVHISEIQRNYTSTIQNGLRFAFDIYDTYKGRQAKNIQVLN